MSNVTTAGLGSRQQITKSWPLASSSACAYHLQAQAYVTYYLRALVQGQSGCSRWQPSCKLQFVGMVKEGPYAQKQVEVECVLTGYSHWRFGFCIVLRTLCCGARVVLRMMVPRPGPCEPPPWPLECCLAGARACSPTPSARRTCSSCCARWAVQEGTGSAMGGCFVAPPAPAC